MDDTYLNMFITAEVSLSFNVSEGFASSSPLSFISMNLAVCWRSTLLSPSYVTEGRMLLNA